MQRIKQLQRLSKEHHQSLVLAQKAINAAQQGDSSVIDELCQQIITTYPDDWMIHFKIEEDSIFKTVAEHYQMVEDTEPDIKQMINLCQQLEQEHRQMEAYYEQMKKGNKDVLEAFGKLLKQHTRTEERQLFPLLEQYCSSDTLDKIYQTSVHYREFK